MEQDEIFMRRALELARRAEGNTSPNPMVGCVIVAEDGSIAGEGWHHKAGAAHAEVNALTAMREQKTHGHTAYVTLEPCSHYGHTGPCCDALIRAGIKRVVVALEDPNPKVAGRGLNRLREAGVKVEVGLCAKEAAALNEKFFVWITQKRPFISLKFAETLDGKIATADGDSFYVTGQEAHRYSHYLRKTHDAILVGIGTVLEDDPELTTRLVEGKNPLRIVLDSKARIPLTAKVLNAAANTLVAVGPEADKEKIAKLAAMDGVEVVTLSCENGQVSLSELLAALAKREVTSVLVEGGSQITGAFFDAELVDRVYAFVAPKLLGGDKALPAVGGKGIPTMGQCACVIDPEFKTLGADWLITGRVRFSAH